MWRRLCSPFMGKYLADGEGMGDFSEEPGAPRRLRGEPVRVLTVVNLVMWVVLFAAWIPYTAAVGPADPISVEVRSILAATAVLMGLLAVVRIRRRRPILG